MCPTQKCAPMQSGRPLRPGAGEQPCPAALTGALEKRGTLVRRTLWKPLDSSWTVLWGEEALGSQLTEQAHPPAPFPTEDSS